MIRSNGAWGEKGIDIAIVVIGVAMAVYQLVSTQYLFFGPILHQNTHLGFALLLVFLTALRKSRKLWPLMLALLLMSVVVTGYVYLFYEDLWLRAAFNTTPDLIIGIILIIVVLVATWEAFGLALPVLGAIFIGYTFFGPHLPGVFQTMALPWDKIVPKLGIGFTGVYGSILAVSANYIFLFVLFGTLLQTTGATRFVIQVGRLISRRMKSGPAMMAVLTSAMIGSVTGTVAANVFVTGSFTIPLMKKMGYKAEQAGAIEAAASTGGQIMPPVMGAAAFLMAGTLGVPYISIAAAALLPAITYYLVVALYVHFQAVKLNLAPMQNEKVDVRELLLLAPLFVVPFALIVFLLVKGYTPMFSAFWAIMALIGLSLLRKKTRPSLSALVRGLADGATRGAQIGVACACVGIILSTLVMSGLGIKFPAAVEAVAGGMLLPALVLTMMVSIILGFGMPTMGAYILVATVTAPVLIKMGLTALQAHFFTFIFANFSYLTPPVAMASLFASRIAGASYIRTAIESVKAGLAGFLLPFMIVWSPVLILQPQDPLSAGTGIMASILALLVLQIVINNAYFAPLSLLERVGAGVCAAALIAYLIVGNLSLLGVGIGSLALLTLWQLRKKRRTAELF